MLRRMVCAAALLGGAALGQTEIYKPYKASVWASDTLYVGASFLYTNPGPITISLKGNYAAWLGWLSVINTATGDTVKLFSNHTMPGSSVDLSLKTAVPIGTTLVFMYQVDSSSTSSLIDRMPRFSGPNLSTDKYVSQATSDGHVVPNLRYGRKWMVVGKVPASSDLEFGFEDQSWSGSDMDFDDIIFRVSGLSLGIFKRDLIGKNLVW